VDILRLKSSTRRFGCQAPIGTLLRLSTLTGEHC